MSVMSNVVLDEAIEVPRPQRVTPKMPVRAQYEKLAPRSTRRISVGNYGKGQSSPKPYDVLRSELSKLSNSELLKVERQLEAFAETGSRSPMLEKYIEILGEPKASVERLN